jgi:hypothetical protein
MEISSFDDLLRMATQQASPQRLLLVFCKAEMPEDATPQQKAEFEAGEGGALVPVASVDKFPEALGSFATLQAEAAEHGLDWDVLFVAAMERTPDEGPDQIAAVDQTLEAMVSAVKAGQVGSFAPFDASGTVLALGG